MNFKRNKRQIMKICYINPTNNIRRPIAELAEILADKGHNVSIVYPISKECPTKNWVANERIKKANIKLIPIESWYLAPLRYNLPNLISLWKAVKQIYKENDKIHIWEYYYPLSVLPLLYAALTGNRKEKREKRNKTILTTDGFVGYSYKPKDPWWLVPAFKIYTKIFARHLFKIPMQMTTYGHSMLPYAKKAGVPMKKLKVIPTGIHLQRFKNINKNKIKEIKKEFDIGSKEKIILFVGMLTERKGIDTVLKISHQLLDEGMDIKTILVGDAHGENNYVKRIRPMYKDRIIFAGGRKEIPEFMKIADVLLLPSEGEGLPGVVMEAMASGLPVVATKEGCTPDLIEDGKDGFLVELNNKQDYFDQVKEQLESNNKKSEVNLSKKIEKFGWDIIFSKYENAYR